ncbi:MAG: exonuclease, partial [Formosimonas sp.]
PYKQAIKPRLPKEWLPENLPHTHVALDDALEQGEIFVSMLRVWQAQQVCE